MIDGLVSVIMPSWNTEDYIRDAIDSVISQTYVNWELIIIDDHSSDNTRKAVEKFTDERIRWIDCDENHGAAIARNIGLREAKGEWIAFLDSDDIWAPEKLEHQLKFMKERGYVFSYTEYERIYEDGKSADVRVSGPKKIGRYKMYMYDYVGQLTMMYSAKEFGLVQIKDIKKNNDYAIRLRLFGKPGAKCYLLPENLAKYRIRAKSISHDKFRKKFRSHYDLFRVCDGRPAPIALFLACRNMFYGVWKKIIYEKAE